ncbi:MAG TPA: UDP-N-acetylmuramate--L-alanine ligase [Candidatus Binatia bacterium]|jgi:UDP-N-acetylmuramate: L-alanyl-gamma-D-glutamyl-meso-diaminopimelate ligase|nr:UDP-N-acetylmuramate--L-alanine ligase [Candidatus Binatia bacterium]
MKVHLIAACGVGMSALAALLREAGHEVTGSDDQAYPPASTLLEELGVTVNSGYDPARLVGADLVVCGNAVRSTNLEATAAREQGMRMTSFPQALEELFLEGRRPLVVAGTHGKTTSASMLAFVLARCGRDPGWLIGGAPRDLGSNANLGGSPWFVVEGDEYDSAYFDKGPKFLHYRPDMVVLTAVEFDHADIYRDLAAVQGAFRKLLGIMRPDAPLIACGDFPHLLDVVEGTHARLVRFGLDAANPWRVTDLVDDGTTTRFRVREHDRVVCEATLQVPGPINARNALGVMLVAHEVGVSWESAASALADFRGVRRRQEVVASVRDVTVIDDFAHHPTAVAGTLAALRLRYPGRRLRAVFEPRSNTSRRRVFQDEFADALATADEAVLAAVFAKPNDPIPADERLAPETIVGDIVRRGVPARTIDGVPAIRDYLVSSAQPGDVIVIMSNGAFGGLPSLVASGLGA